MLSETPPEPMADAAHANDELATPGQAWLRGQALAQAGDKAGAKLWLDRAARLAPEDPRIQLDLASCLIGQGRAEALEAGAAIFARLAERYEIAAAWLGLLTARRLGGNHEAAAAALGRMLGRHCLPEGPQFASVAALLVSAAGAAGWCGVTGDGILRIDAAADAVLELRLDGKPYEPVPVASGFVLPDGGLLEIAADGLALAGSPLDLAALRRIEGVLDAGPAGLSGWAARPAAPEQRPDLKLTDAKGVAIPLAYIGELAADDDAPFLRRHEFAVPAAALAGLQPPFCLRTPAGRDLFGSPADPAAMLLPPVLATARGRKVTLIPPRRSLAVVVPVYRGLAVTQACLDSLFAALPEDARVIVVDDATPEQALAAWLDRLTGEGRIILRRHARNLGFPAAANTGIAIAGRSDVLLLNSDTLVPPGAISLLRDVAYSRGDIGSVTPLSNAATILNYPNPAGENEVPDLAETIRLDQLARRANSILAVEIPTGVGFCMFLRHDCLAATGGFRGEIFAQGYGEENDWCLRARQRGFAHVAAPGAFVAHLSGVSFGPAGLALNRRNAVRLNRLYPGYHEMIMDAIATDALAPARRRVDATRFAAGRNAAGAVLLISHNHGGGVARRIRAEMDAIIAAGQRPILLFPGAPADLLNTPFPWAAQLTDGGFDDYPSLRFSLPAELPMLLHLLKAERVARVELHHGLGHHACVREIAAQLGVPQDITVHDYASFCPRVNLLTRPAPAARLRYCGEPNLATCEACVAENGDETFEGLSVAEVIARSGAEFAAARRITAPSADAAQRITRHFPGVKPMVTPWEDDAVPVNLQPPRAEGRRKIVIIGGIGPAKGFDLLIDCALDAVARDLPLDFIVAGASAEDARLLETGRIFVTGAYKPEETTRLIRSLDADLAFQPSIWPETWCFTLTEAWRAGLYTVAFDLGAQGARIRATGRGMLLPLGLPIARINDALLAWQPKLRNSQPAKQAVS
jgi:GT2 family glycosyltransferase/glycosyltransferase involved in cell wall biosynthesis